MPVVQKGDKAFPGAGTKPGLEIWRIEFFKPIKVPVKEHGKFYKGDSYIILQTIAVDQKANIFFWLGPDSTQDEVGAAAQLSVALDDELNGFPVQHRVIGGHEDNQFKKLFPHIMMLNGGHESGFQEGKKKFKKVLLQVKGRKNAYASEVVLSVDSLNTGDSFVLDCGRTIYAWNGSEANRTEKITALKFARELRDEERAGLATVCAVETPEEQEEFFFEITGHKRIVPITKPASSDESFEGSSVCNLYRVKEVEGNITMKETGSKPLNRKDLDSDDCFILETSSVVYVWQGKKSSRKEKQVQCHSDAQGFLSARQLDPKTPYKIVKEDLEPTDFKQYFIEWEESVPYGMTKTYTTGKGIATKEQLEKQPKFEVKSMHKRRKSVVSLLPDDGTGTVQVWRVKNFDVEEVPSISHGVFYSGDCYIVLYTYLKNSKERHIIYFWLGNDSTADEQGTAASRAVAMDDSFGGEPYQVRVCEGREPEHFFLIFKHKLVIYQGGHASGFKGTTQQQATSPDVRLLQVRVTGENSRIVEVAPFAQSLNSSDVFVLHDHHRCYIWVGKGSIGDEKESARNVVDSLGKTNVELLREGHDNDEEFWNLLGGKAEYGSQKQNWGDGSDAEIQVTARLFHCSNASGQFKVEEILDFTQEDLEEDDVMILDAWTELFVWIGQSARNEEKHDAIKTALEYVKTDPRDRSQNMTMSVIKQGTEPLAFKSHFLAWEPQMWNKKMSYEDQLNAIRRDNESVDVNAWTLTEWNEKLKPKCYPLEVLQQREPPDGVNPTQKELHLEDDKFVELFNMTKKEWETVPQWRKNEKKKTLKLF